MIKPLDTEGYTKGSMWCGPSAVALLTGAPLTFTTSRLAAMSKRSYAKTEGVWPDECVLLLHELGYQSKRVDIAARYPDRPYGPTLERYMRERRIHDPWEEYNPTMIEVDGHLMTGHYGMLFDNWVPKGAPVALFPKTRRLVKNVWVVTPRAVN
jgi:hypothetical protein